MDKEKRMAGSYEIKLAHRIGNKEIVYGEDTKPQSDNPYIIANYTSNELFGQYDNAVCSTDYLEIMEEFVSRVKNQINMLREAQQQIAVDREPVTIEHCYPDDLDKSIENMVVAIRPSSLRPEYRSADCQLVLVTSGFGAQGKARGRAVFTKNLYHGYEERWNRSDILGVIKDECLPEWAAEKLQQMRPQDEGHTESPDLSM